MSQQCDGHSSGATSCPTGSLHCCYKRMKGCRRESSDPNLGQSGSHCSSGPIPHVTSTTARTVIRKLGRNWISVALSLLIVAFVVVTLWHLLRDISVSKVVAALTAQPIHNIVIA